MKYRKDIDGLRALAVLPVVLFHSGFNLFSGGFAGVDIFFVISGYLITTILLNELENDSYSIVDFYERRARRILPALVFVVIFTLPFAWFFLLPTDFISYGKSLIGVSTFSSNIIFSREAGYFSPDVDLKPLLHTWSLAVEEQFYIFFPILLSMLFKFKKFLITSIVFIFVASFLLSLFFVDTHPSEAYFLLPTRAWELLAGSICSFYVFHNGKSGFRESTNSLLSLVGLGLIVFSIFCFDENTPHPSYPAILPVLGASLILLYGNSVVGNYVLGNRIFVSVGVISYSVYLWHQPLIAFYKYYVSYDFGLLIKLLFVFLSLLFGFLSYRFIESPFRKMKGSKSGFSRRFIFNSSLLSLILLAFVGAVIYLNAGFSKRFSEKQAFYNQYSDYVSYLKENHPKALETCFLQRDGKFSDYSIECLKTGDNVIWGDSHAQAISRGFKNYSLISGSACPPLLNQDMLTRPLCKQNNQKIADVLVRNKPKVLILHAYWAHYGVDGVKWGLIDTIEKFRHGSPETSIYIIGGVPLWNERGLPYEIIEDLAKYNYDEKEIRKTANVESVQKLDDVIVQVAKAYQNVSYLPVLQKVCEREQCIAYVGKKRIPFAWDNAHLTIEGAEFLVPLISKEIK